MKPTSVFEVPSIAEQFNLLHPIGKNIPFRYPVAESHAAVAAQKRARNLRIWLVIGVAALVAWNVSKRKKKEEELYYFNSNQNQNL